MRQEIKKIGQALFLFFEVISFYFVFSKKVVLPFDDLTKTILEFFIIINSYYFLKITILKYKDIFPNKWLLLLFLFINLIISFFIGGKKLFLTNDIVDLSLGSLAGYFFLNLIVFPLIYNFIYLLDRIDLHEKKKKITKKDIIQFAIIIFLICFIIWGVSSISFFPGNMTSDSIDQICQALGVYPITDSHPAFYTIILRLILKVWSHPYAIILSNILFFSFIITYIFTYLYKRGFKGSYLIIAALLFSLSCNNLSLVSILWKDIPFTISLLWLILELYRIIKEKDDYFKNILNMISLLICLLLVYILRPNGMFPYFITICYLIYYIFHSDVKKNIIILIVVSFFTIWFIKNPLYKMFNVQSQSSEGSMVSFAAKGLGALVYYDADLSESDIDDIKVIQSFDVLKKNYSPYNIDTYAFGEENWADGLEELGLQKIYKLYIKHIFLNPRTIIRDRLDSNNLLWSYITPDDGFNSTYVQGIWYPANFDAKLIDLEMNEENVYVPEKNLINKIVMKYQDVVNSNLMLYMLFWRASIPLTFLLLLMYFMIIKRIHLFPILFPTLINILFWVMLMSHQSYRYVWFIFVNTFISYIFVINEKNLKDKNLS